MFASDGTPHDRWSDDAAGRAPGEGPSDVPNGSRATRVDEAMGDGQSQVALERVTLLICDDHRLLTDTLSTVVDSDDSLVMVRPPVHEPEEAIGIAALEHPDVVLMDIRFKGPMSGIEATRRIKDASPATKVVIMTAHEDPRLLVEAVEAGASGFLRKTEGLDEFLGAVKSAAAGEILIDRVALAQLLPLVARERAQHREAELLLSQLTDREHEVLQLLAEGHRNEDIAAKLFISPQTVQTHVRNVLGKLGVHSKLEAVTFAVRHGAVSV
jgi:DNA-binding NarL/FixJ family response regulator